MFARWSLMLGLVVALMMSFASFSGPVNASGGPNACCFKHAFCCIKRSECCPKRAAVTENAGALLTPASMNN